MRGYQRFAALGATLLLTAGAQAESMRTPQMLANTCAGCHGTNGASVGLYMPTIAGLNSEYLYEVLTDYREDVRENTIMGRIMKGYNDQDIQAMAQWFAGQAWVSGKDKIDAGLVAMGRKVHESECEKCHEEGGRSQEDESPRIAGQWTGYLHHYLDVCREIGKDCEPRKMGRRVMKLSDQELEALAHYYASQK